MGHIHEDMGYAYSLDQYFCISTACSENIHNGYMYFDTSCGY
jgi:hypothetical protein